MSGDRHPATVSPLQLHGAQRWSGIVAPLAAAALALGIFLLDAFSALGIAVAVLYGIVVLISATVCDRRGVVFVAIGCAVLTLAAYVIGHAEDALESGPVLRCLVSLAALAVTTFLTVKNQTATLVLAASEQRYRSIFQSNAVAIWEVDYSAVAAELKRLRAAGAGDLEAYLEKNPDAVRRCLELIRTVNANDAAIRLVEADSKAQLLSYLPRFFTPESLPHVKSLLLALAERRPGIESETQMQTLRGGRRSILVTAAFPSDMLHADSVLVSVIDITERSRAERALAEARNELAHISRVTTLGELTASIAHEVNQPLAAIVSNGEACLRWLNRPEPDLGEARANVEQIIGQGRRAAGVIERLRALSKNSAPQRAAIDLNHLIRETLSLLDREIAESGVSLRLVLQPSLPEVSVDRIQVQQVIINLIMNALQAMEAVDVRELRIASRRAAGGMVEMAVSDSGVGLTAEAMSRLFTSFYTTKPQGMGMGLSICRSIVETQGGTIRAERNALAGATFIVTFPQETA